MWQVIGYVFLGLVCLFVVFSIANFIDIWRQKRFSDETQEVGDDDPWD